MRSMTKLIGQVAALPRGLLGMIGWIVLIEGVIASYHLDLTRFYIHDWRVVGNTVQSRAQGRSILCFGDSLVKYGVLPRVIEEQTDTRAYNLALCGGQAASSYFLLRRAIETKAKPSLVLVDFAPHLLMAGPRHSLRLWPELLRLREGIDLGFTATHAGFCAELALRSILPSLKDRDELRGNIIAALRGSTGSKRDEVLAHRQVWDDNLGADVHPGDRSFDVEADLDNPGYFPKRWSCHRVNRNYLHRFLELASANQVQVVWLLPPVVPKFQARRDELGLEAMYTSFLKPWLMEYPNLSVLDARHSGYDSSLFIDSLHLSRRGAEAFSREIATALASIGSAHSSSERWTRLPDLGTERSGPLTNEARGSSIALRTSSQGHRR